MQDSYDDRIKTCEMISHIDLNEVEWNDHGNEEIRKMSMDLKLT